mgnify:CR=1 FL=1
MRSSFRGPINVFNFAAAVSKRQRKLHEILLFQIRLNFHILLHCFLEMNGNEEKNRAEVAALKATQLSRACLTSRLKFR